MKTIGLLGGMSWESTVSYYRAINRYVGTALGGLHSAPILLVSVDFHDIERLQQANLWKEAGEYLTRTAVRLEQAGAECVVLCTNTMHKIADTIERAVAIPLLHIADATAERVRASGIATVGLLGTRFTMEEDFYPGRLRGRHGLEVLVPEPEERSMVHRVIYEELCRGRVLDSSRAEYREVVAGLVARGAEGIVLGCTEIGLLLRPEDAPVPLFDTAQIHAEFAARFALGELTPDRSG